MIATCAKICGSRTDVESKWQTRYLPSYVSRLTTPAPFSFYIQTSLELSVNFPGTSQVKYCPGGYWRIDAYLRVERKYLEIFKPRYT